MEYLLFLNVLMATRLGYLRRDGAAGVGFTVVLLLVPLLALGVYRFSAALVALAVLVTVATLVSAVLEQRRADPVGLRSATFVLLAPIAGLLFGGELEFATWSRTAFSAVTAASAWTRGIDAAGWAQANVLLLGALLLTNEVNLMIRFGFAKLGLEPKTAPADAGVAAGATGPDTDITEYNAGRVIGILERYLIYAVLLATSDYSAIAFIIAVKGFARFKQLDDRAFAEYMLTGTLASALAAIVVANVVGALIP